MSSKKANTWATKKKTVAKKKEKDNVLNEDLNKDVCVENAPKKQYYRKKERPLGKYLIIVESPAKCSKIEGFLGEDYTCISSIGHLRCISGLHAIHPESNFEITYTNIDNKEDHIEWMRTIISKYTYNNIYIGTDDDREGMAIAWHICVLFNLPISQTPRILFNEITKTALEAAIQNPTLIDMNMVHAQNARQILDMFVGFKISPYLWKRFYSSKSAPLSAGRCQTPALRLIYDNQKEINAYMKRGLETKYKITGYFFSKNLPFELNVEYNTKDEVESFLRKSQPFTHTLVLEAPKESISSPPKPLNTSRLLQTASNQLSLSPKQTMHYCQMLYQSGYITYMRTDAITYSKEFLEKARTYITGKWDASYVGDLDKIENKNDDNPHEAIRATQLSLIEVQCEDPKMATLYKLIWRHSLESCMSDAVIKKIDACILAPDNTHYKHTIEIPKFNGWRAVKTLSSKHAEGEAIYMYLQTIQSPPIYNKIDATVKLSGSPPSHYTEASLIQKLEDLGIGRPSTFSYIVETIHERGYVKKTDISGEIMECNEYSILRGTPHIVSTKQTRVFGKESGKLVIQPLGSEVIEFLTEHFDTLFDYGYTQNMETQLDLISRDSTIVWHSICRECVEEINRLAQCLPTIRKIVYPLEDNYELCFTKNGMVIRKVDNEEDASYEYTSLKKGITLDLDKLRRGEYRISDLMETMVRDLGEYDGKDVYLRNGKYGVFIEWGDKKFACKDIPSIGDNPSCGIDEIPAESVLSFLEQERGVRHAPKNSNILRVIDSDLSIRTGKYGPYIFYQNSEMKKPAFYKISKFKESFQTCDAEKFKEWCRETYGFPYDPFP